MAITSTTLRVSVKVGDGKTDTYEKDGITFNMSERLPIRFDAAGDAYMTLPESGSPTLTTLPESVEYSGSFEGGGSYTRFIHGMMTNCIAGVVPQGFDESKGSLGRVAYDGAANEALSPLTLAPGTTIKALSDLTPDSTGRSSVDRYLSLTFVETEPRPGAILGQAQTTAEADEFNRSDINLSVLPRFATPTGQTKPNIAALIDIMRNTRIFLTNNIDDMRSIHPTDPPEDAHGYGGQGGNYGDTRGDVLQALTLDYTDAELMELAILVVREGECLYRYIKAGNYMNPQGALGNGRFPVLVFTAALLDNTEMKEMCDLAGSYLGVSNRFRWQDGNQHQYVDKTLVEEKKPMSERSGLFSQLTGFDSSSGYVQGDVVELTGGAPYRGTRNQEYVITSVDGTGKVLEVDFNWRVPYHTIPTGVANKSGSMAGSGLTTPGRSISSKLTIYNEGMIGAPEYGSNIISPAGDSGGANCEFFSLYRLNNMRGYAGGFMAMAAVPECKAIVNYPPLFDYLNRMRFFADASFLSNEKLTDFHIAYFDDYVGYTDPAPGAPAITEIGVKDNVVWIKYNKLLLENRGRDGSNNVEPNGPEASDYDVQVAGSAATLVPDGPNPRMMADGVYLYLDAPVATGDSVTVAYTKGTSPLVIEDHFGNEAASFTATAATNYTTTYTNPSPGSKIPDNDFRYEGLNFWEDEDIEYLSAEDTFGYRLRPDQEGGANIFLSTDRFDVTAAETFDVGFNVVNYQGPASSIWVDRITYDSGGSPTNSRATFTINGNGEFSSSFTVPAGAVSMKIDLRRQFGSDDSGGFDIDYWV